MAIHRELYKHSNFISTLIPPITLTHTQQLIKMKKVFVYYSFVCFHSYYCDQSISYHSLISNWFKMEYVKRNNKHLLIGKPLETLPIDRIPSNREVLANILWNREVLHHDQQSAIDITLFSVINTCQLLDIAHSEHKNLKKKLLSKEGLLHRYNNATISSFKNRQPQSSFDFVQSLDNEYDCRSKAIRTVQRRNADEKRFQNQRLKELRRTAENSIIYNYCGSSDEEDDEKEEKCGLVDDSMTIEEACSIAEELADPTYKPRIKSEFKKRIEIINPDLLDCLDRVRLSGKIGDFSNLFENNLLKKDLNFKKLWH